MLAENSGYEMGARALAAVAFADVVNFSSMMATDEWRTFQAVEHLLETVVAAKTAAHGGIVVKWTGDGLLARFSEGLAAVAWAEAVQHDAGLLAGPFGAPLQLRIAINLGRVILSKDDIFGDEVNVAARLLAYAPPGGIALSEPVHALLQERGGSRAVDLGARTLKSFTRAVRVFALVPDGVALSSMLGDSSVPSIAVLPLENLGGDPSDDYFANGVVEDIIVSLAGLGELRVVSRASTLAFAGRRVDPRDVARVLGVRYVLTGTLRRSERSIRVGVQLCDGETGRALWSELADATPGELFSVQDWLVGKIVNGIAPNIRATELRRAMRKVPGSFTAYDHTLRALHLMHKLDGDDFVAAGELLRRAVADDPEFAMPHAWLARWHMLRIGQGRSGQPREDMVQAGRSAERGTELDPNNSLALAHHGHVRSFLFHDYDSGLLLFDRALAASPSNSVSWVLSAASLAYTGQGERAVRHAEHGLRLSPLDRNIYLTYNILCLAYYSHGAFGEAIRWGRRSLEQHPSYTATHRALVGSLVADGQVDEARQVARAMLEHEPDFNLDRWKRTLQPFRGEKDARLYAERMAVGFGDLIVT